MAASASSKRAQDMRGAYRPAGRVSIPFSSPSAKGVPFHLMPPSELPWGLTRRLAEVFPGWTVVRSRALGADDAPADDTTKGLGYGCPLQVTLEAPTGARQDVVLHVANADDFGHDRRSDRAAAHLLAFDTFGLVPQHTRALDVGAVRRDGSLVSLADAGEFYLLTTWAEGAVYASDLRRIAETGLATPLDGARRQSLLEVLDVLHAQPGTHPAAYTRAVRDLVGSGEGLAGIIDGFPDDVPAAPRHRLEALERRCLQWRHRLRARTHRLRRTHGDFHPFNLVFADGSATPGLLDTSRGSEGDPADDLACLAVNDVFFALTHPGSWERGLGVLWRQTWAHASKRGDAELFEVVAPWLAWRLCVLSNPRWYPHVSEAQRDALLRFAECALDSPRFDPALGEAVVQGGLEAPSPRGVVVWFTGLPSSGKSTLAGEVARAVPAAVVLDGDEVRRWLVPSPGYGEADREAFYETLGKAAAGLARQGQVVLVPATAHRRAMRAKAKAVAPAFVEVFLETPPEVCAARDAKGLYASDVAGLPGRGVAYEVPLEPDVRVRPGDEGAVRAVIEALRRARAGVG
jgi:adenylylsulfate kinase-like enzyme/aminoglycoside phosphotransferase (APT) family kinase protein